MHNLLAVHHLQVFHTYTRTDSTMKLSLSLLSILVSCAFAQRGMFKFKTIATGAQQITATDTIVTAELHMEVDRGFTAMDYELDVSNGTMITQAHLHCEAAGSNGPVVVWLFPAPDGPAGPGIDVDGRLSEGTFTNDNIVNNTCGTNIVSLFESMKKGMVYVHAHSLEYPSGEVRGQVLTFPY
jgi:hypothetical protein